MTKSITHLNKWEWPKFPKLSNLEQIFPMLVRRKIRRAHQFTLQSQHNITRFNKDSVCLCTCVNAQTPDQFCMWLWKQTS